MRTLRGFVFSDLHINARSSRYEEIKPRLHKEIEKSDVIVLNGDIIEMFYPKHLNHYKRVHNAYIEAAKDGAAWVDALLEKYPDKKFMYLEGNHENCDIFRDNVHALRDKYPNLTWGRTYMSIGDGNFFHGDNEVRNKDVEKREKGQLKDIISGRLHEGVNLTAEFPIMSAMRVINADNKIVDRMYKFLEKVHPERLEKANHMFFGHTHLPFTALERHGKFWHNTGSASRFGKDNFLSFELEVPDGCKFRTDDKRVFYPEATIGKVQRVDMGGKFTEMVALATSAQSR